jgi:hypothetical protein
MVAEMRRRHGRTVAAVIFYGSCLRTERYDEGVLDFYVVVDAYADAHRSRVLAWANALLPPNVFYCEVTTGERTLRAKYAVISVADFERGARPASVQSIIWARFSQPAMLVYVRDAPAREAIVRATAEASITMVMRAAATFGTSSFRPDELWQHGFRETYRAELRVESVATIRAIYDAAPERYDRLATAALEELARRGILSVTAANGRLRVEMAAARRRRLRLGWIARRLAGKPLAAARLLKTTATFGDWVPYALWKVERHTGVHIELTPWQRRHVWLAIWPVVFRLLFRRALY